jgi:hypothetical protein
MRAMLIESEVFQNFIVRKLTLLSRFLGLQSLSHNKASFVLLSQGVYMQSACEQTLARARHRFDDFLIFGKAFSTCEQQTQAN